jgi:thymidine phosphorylase
MERFAEYLPVARISRDVFPEADGIVTAIDARAVGLAVVELGGGRRRADDAIEYSVGFDHLVGIGASVDERWPLGRVHAETEEAAEAAEARLRAAYAIGDTPPAPSDEIKGRIGPRD